MSKQRSEQSDERQSGWGLGRTLRWGFTFFLVAAGALFIHYRAVTRAVVLEESRRISFVIPEGAGWNAIVDRLDEVGLVENRLYFEAWARMRGLPRQVRAGSFDLEGPLRWSTLAERLAEGGKARDLRVTFPEGFTIFHMADRVDKVGLAGREAFLEAARDDALLEKWDIRGDSFEGYLFPDTYRFRPDARVTVVIERMHRRWREIWGEVAEAHRQEYAAIQREYGFDRHDVVTLASIAEAETSVSAELPLVARVIYNRLDRPMRLQTDPTCVYGEETYLDVPSPGSCKDPTNTYSTYVIDGLPPGPIGNPGRHSLAAALNPSDAPEAADYLFYVAKRDGTGRHHFSETYREHRRAVRRFLK